MSGPFRERITQGQAPNAIVTDIERQDTGEPKTETYTGGPLGGLKVETRLDGQLRRDRLWLKQGANALATTVYNYQPTSSRLDSVTDDGSYSGASASAFRASGAGSARHRRAGRHCVLGEECVARDDWEGEHNRS